MKIIADANIPFAREAFGPLGDVRLARGRELTAAAVADADALLVRSVTPVNAALLAGSRVKFVATATIGADHVDEAWLRAAGIGFANAAGCNAQSVAEYIVAALLELAARGGYRLSGRTLGVVGVGNVGSRVARAARALGMRALENDPPRQAAEGRTDFVTLERVLAEADIVTLHVPLLAATRHLLNAGNLGRFTLLNTARGAVVDNRALLTANLPGLALDVWEGEPRLLPGLLERCDLGTPHIAGYSDDGKVNGTRLIYRAVCAHFGLAPSWEPTLPAGPTVTVELPPGAADEDALRAVIRPCYDIQRDDAALRQDPGRFDKLRAEYPVRREWRHVDLRLTGGSASARAKLAALGFAV